MNSKIFSVCLMTLLSAILLLSLTSAAVTFSPSSVSVYANPGDTSLSVSFGMNNTDSFAYNLTNWSVSSGSISSAGPSSISASTNLASQSISISYTVPSNAAPGLSTTLNVSVNATSGTTLNAIALSVPVYVNKVNSISLTQLVALTKTQNGTINVSNNGNTQITVNLTSAGFGVTFSQSQVTLGAYSSAKVNVSASDLSNLVLGNNVPVINAVDSNASVTNAPISLSMSSIQKSLCLNGPTEKRNLTINDVSIDAAIGTEEKWKPLDSITIDVEVKNIGQDTVDDVFVQMFLYNSDGTDVASNLDFNNSDEETFDLGSVSDGEREIATFQFKVPADLERGTYKLAFKVYSTDLGEDLECIDQSSQLSSISSSSAGLFKQITLERYSSSSDEGKFIAFDEIKVSPSDAVCGDTMTMTFKVANVGSKNQKQVRVNLVSKELSISQSYVLKNGLDIGEDKVLTFSFSVPQVVDKVYSLSLTADYDYSNDAYDLSTEEATRVSLKVFGCTTPATPAATVALQVDSDSETKAGSPLTVKATVRNTGNVTLPFVISAKSFDSWADLSSISDQLVSLAPGESKEITIVLNVKSGISGEQGLLVEARSSDRIATQALQVDIASSSWLPASLQGNAMVWVIGALNVLLVLIIIAVAIRVARR